MMDKTTLPVPFSTSIYRSGVSLSGEEDPKAEKKSPLSAPLDGSNRTSVSGNRAGEARQTGTANWVSSGDISTSQVPIASPASPTVGKSPKALSASAGIDIAAKGIYSNLLPALFADRRSKLRRTSGQIDAFLKEDLNVERLNQVHGWLWMVGRPQAGRPLHRQIMMDRSIIVTEQTDLHLTWNNSYIYVKPLPKYLLCREFWAEYLCNDVDLHANACGFLLSYLWLIRYESDFLIAAKDFQVPCLLPSEISWNDWKTFIDEFLDWVDLETPNEPMAVCKVNPRYEYGELRLGRLNKIYRFAPLWWYKHIFRGYHYGYHQYSDFFSRNFAWLIIAFAYITVVLTAMQVGLALDDLKDDPRLTNASYGFTVFSLVLIIAVVGIALLLFSTLLTYNLIATAIAQVARTRKKTMNEGGRTGH